MSTAHTAHSITDTVLPAELTAPCVTTSNRTLRLKWHFLFEGQFKARKILRITATYCAYHLAEYVTIMWIHGRIQSRLDAALVYRAPWQFGVREHIGALLMTFGALAMQAWTVWRPLYQFKYWCSNRNTLSCYYYITIFANMMWSCCLCFQ